MRWIDGLRSVAEMFQNPLDYCGFLDAGDDAQPTAALAAGLDVDGEHPLEALCLRLIARCRSVGDGSPRLLVAAVRSMKISSASGGTSDQFSVMYSAKSGPTTLPKAELMVNDGYEIVC
jgi:hypothetical protein